MSNTDTCSVVILAAGRSRRMGFPKPFLPWYDGKTFLEKIIGEYRRFGCTEIIIVVNEHFLGHYVDGAYSFLQEERIITNRCLDFGRFFSVKIGLRSLRNKEYCFIQDVDNPFVDCGVLMELYRYRRDTEYVSPRFNNRGGHPILINQSVIDRIIHHPQDDEVLSKVLEKCGRIVVPIESPAVIRNVNTIEDYRRYFGMDFDIQEKRISNGRFA